MVCQNFSFKSTGFFCKPIDLLLKLSLNFDHLCIMTLRSLIISILKSSVLLLVKHCIGVIKVRRIPNPQKSLGRILSNPSPRQFSLKLQRLILSTPTPVSISRINCILSSFLLTCFLGF